MNHTEIALLDGRRPLPLGDVIGLTLTLKRYTFSDCIIGKTVTDVNIFIL
jgi:hypothetical protein